MQLIAVVVLFWQRRRVSSLLRRAWAWRTTTDTATGASAGGGRRASATRLAKQAAGRGWRAVDTEANAGRVSHFVAWMRGLAATGAVARTSSTNGPAV